MNNRSWFLTVVLLLTILSASGLARDNSKFLYAESKANQHILVQPASDPAVEIDIIWPSLYGVQQTGVIDAFYDCAGMFGTGLSPFSNYMPYSDQFSFTTPPGSDISYLFGGTMWVGGIVNGDTLVSVGADGWMLTRNMFPTGVEGQTVRKIEHKHTDFSMRAKFSDTVITVYNPYSGYTDHTSLNLLFSNRSHAWHSAPYNNTIIYDMVVTNIGDQLIEKGYIGFYMDADVCYDCDTYNGFQDDLAGSLRDQGIAYVIDNDGDLSTDNPAPKIFAFKILMTSFESTDTSFAWWISNGNASLDFGPRQKGTPENPFRDFGTRGLGTPEGTNNKYYIMSFPEWDYDQCYTASIPSSDPDWLYPNPDLAPDFSDGYDTRFLLSIGPFNLPPDSSFRILYTTFTADKVHTDSNNILNLPDHPDIYTSNLDFSGVIANATLSESLVDSLLNTHDPVIGLDIAYADADSAIIEWDPWVFDEVEGYEIYVSEVPLESLPYPGVAAPWLKPEELILHASLLSTHEYTIKGLDPDLLYFVNVAQRSIAYISNIGDPVFVKSGGRPEAPGLICEYTFFQENYPAIINWTEPAGVDIDHYNIYRFDNHNDADDKYHAFYNERDNSQGLVPKDSFTTESGIFYYYAMEIYGQADSGVTSFVDSNPSDSNVFIITAVDKNGFESDFSPEIISYLTGARNKDILVLTYSGPENFQFVIYDTLESFYTQLLTDYDWNIYKVMDTLNFAINPTAEMNWKDFMPYKMVIIDDGIIDKIWKSTYEHIHEGFTKYLLSGGQLAYFGAFNGFTIKTPSSETGIYPLNFYDPINRFFGVDSVYFVTPTHYRKYTEEPYIDTSFGFIGAFNIDPEYPELSFDSTSGRFNSYYAKYWPTNTAPSVATFKVNANGEVTHTFNSLYPSTSYVHDEPVGIKTETSEATTYLFGFHLWYMDINDARLLITKLMSDIQTDVNDDNITAPLPEKFLLNQNYPNPFNPTTTIDFAIPFKSHVTLDVFNILGQKVSTLINDTKSAGTYSVNWGGTDHFGNPAATGIYFYRLKTDDFTQTRKMLLLK